jgi:uncharacterized protein with ATP-grasp and redox domains
LAVLSLIADPRSYRACEWDLSDDAGARAYWLNLFRTHIHTISDLLRTELGPAGDGRVDAFLKDYLDGLRPLDANSDAWRHLTVLKLTAYRQELQKRHGFADPFARIKAKETQKAVELYPQVIAGLDRLEPPQRMEALAHGIFAGNEFDLGSEATTALYHDDGHDFTEAIGRVSPRPWPEDDFDEWCAHAMRRPGYRRVLFFVDNAGADAVLGCIPFARELSRAGAGVTLAANTEPSLNDITVEELDAVIDSLRPLDPTLDAAVADGRLRTVASGCTTPLIDLAEISDACNEAARGADLLILEGMGRSVESNRSTVFTCDTLWIALIKDAFVARRIGVELFSPVWRFREAARATAAG